MTSTLQQLYNSGINFQLSTFWDSGFDVFLGDELNGIKASTHVSSLDEAVEWLVEQAAIHFPLSEFVIRSKTA